MMYYSYSFLSAHWALLLTLPSGGFVQVSSTKIPKWSDFFPLFPIFSFLAWEILLISFFAVTKYLPEKNESGRKILNFFQFFLRSSRNPGRLQTSIFPKIVPLGDSFWTFLQISFSIGDRLRTSIFPKILQMVQKFLSFFHYFQLFLSRAGNYYRSSHTSIFPKILQMVRIFLNFLEKSFPVRLISKQVSSQKIHEWCLFLLFFNFLSSSMGMLRKQVA